MKLSIEILLVLHGLIHLVGFLNAFEFKTAPQLRYPISRPMGTIWLMNFFLYMGATIMIVLNFPGATVVTLSACIVSQVLIFTTWTDSKYGTIANILIIAYMISQLVQGS